MYKSFIQIYNSSCFVNLRRRSKTQDSIQKPHENNDELESNSIIREINIDWLDEYYQRFYDDYGKFLQLLPDYDGKK